MYIQPVLCTCMILIPEETKKNVDATWFLPLSETSLMKYNFDSMHFLIIEAESGYDRNTGK